MNLLQVHLGDGLAPLLLGAGAGALVTWAILRLAHRLAVARLVREARERALKASGSVLKGQAAEQLAPLASEFPYLPSDSRFLGSPVDYLVFDGLAEGDDLEIVFLEVKTGEARLSARERRIREAVEGGRVRWEELRL